MNRKKLPGERSGWTHRFALGEGDERIRLYLTVGLYPDGRLGEIFLVADKQGSLLSALLDAVATLFSISLQYGVPLSTLVGKLRNTRFEPMIVTDGLPEIPTALSILDYLGRYLDLRFPDGIAVERKEKV